MLIERPELWLSALVGAFVLPPGVWLWLLALAAWQRRRRPWLARLCVGGTMLTLYVLSTPWLAAQLQHSVEIATPIRAADLQQVDAIVVLGGGRREAAADQGGMDTISDGQLVRLRHAAQLARQSGKPLLASGGSPEGGPAEAELMALSLAQDFATPVRWQETRSVNTAENARFSAEILHAAGVRRIALVTHSWHMPRALRSFAATGLQVIPAPTGQSRPTLRLPYSVLPSAQALWHSSQALREGVGLLAYALRGVF